MIARFKCYWDSLSPHKKRCQNFLDPRMVVAYIDDAHRRARGLYMKINNLLIFLFNLSCCCFCTWPGNSTSQNDVISGRVDRLAI